MEIRYVQFFVKKLCLFHHRKTFADIFERGERSVRGWGPFESRAINFPCTTTPLYNPLRPPPGHFSGANPSLGSLNQLEIRISHTDRGHHMCKLSSVLEGDNWSTDRWYTKP